MAYTSLFPFSVQETAAIKVKSFFSIIYSHNVCSLLIIYPTGSYYYIYFFGNKQEISESPPIFFPASLAQTWSFR